MKRSFIVGALLPSMFGCHRDEPIIAGESLSHWEREAKQVSFFSFWNSDKDEHRRVAFRHLTELGEPAVPTLVRLLETDNVSVSGDALNALCALGARARSAVPDLMKGLVESDIASRRSAAMVLGCIGPAAAPAIPGLAQARMDTTVALDYVRKALNDDSPEVRARGVEILITQRGIVSGEHVDLLVQAMRDSSMIVRQTADRVSTYVAQRGASPRFLAAVLKGGDVGSRADAAWRLSLMLDDPLERARLEPEDFERAYDALANARHDPDRTVRIYVVRGLAAAGKLAKPMLIGRLRHELPNASIDVAVRGASVLWRLTQRFNDVKPFYLAGLASDDRWIRLETLGEITKMSSAGRPFAPAIEKLRDDPDRDVRERAARALGIITA